MSVFRGLVAVVSLPAAAIAFASVATALTDKSDTKALMAALNELMQFAAPGRAVTWQNPQTGNSGKVKALQTVKQGGKTCWRYERTYWDAGRTMAIQGTSCETLPGFWSIAAEDSPRPLAAAASQSSTAQPAPAPSAPQSQRADRESVIWAQSLLDQLGYDPGPADGAPGRRTRAAVSAFQQDKGLPATGQITPALVALLKKEVAGRAAVQAIQQQQTAQATNPAPAPAPAPRQFGTTPVQPNRTTTQRAQFNTIESGLACGGTFDTGKTGGLGKFIKTVDVQRYMLGKTFQLKPWRGDKSRIFVVRYGRPAGNRLDASVWIDGKEARHQAQLKQNAVCYQDRGRQRCFTVSADNSGRLEPLQLVERYKGHRCGRDFISYGQLNEVSIQDANRLISAEQSKVQTTQAAEQAALNAGKPVPLSSIRSNDFARRHLFGNLYESRYHKIPKDYQANLYLNVYVEEFSRRCAAYLPKNAKSYVHRRQQYSHSDYNLLRTTHYYETVIDRVIKMKPEAYDPYRYGLSTNLPKVLKHWQETGRDLKLHELALVIDDHIKAVQGDTQKLFQRYGCDSPTTRKFERGLLGYFRPA